MRIGIGYTSRETVTAENIAEIKQSISCDQAYELEVGCETWGILYQPGNQRGQITVWPNERAAICLGGDSSWGDWMPNQQIIILDDTDDEGAQIVYDADGNESAYINGINN